MNLWDGVCMFFIYASMLEFIIVNYLYRNLGLRKRAAAVRRPSRPASADPLRAAAGGAPPRIQEHLEMKEQHPSSNHRASPGGLSAEQENSLLRPAAPGLAGLDTSVSATEDLGIGSDRPPSGGQRLRAVASVLAWLRRPQLLPRQLPPKPRIAKAIDYFSRTVFPALFGAFTFGFFLAYAVIGPAEDENWKLIEY